jgi:hypothetical protein
MNPLATLGLVRIVSGVAAIFGVGLVLKEAKETVAVVPKSLDSLKALLIPITLIAAVFFVRALKGK